MKAEFTSLTKNKKKLKALIEACLFSSPSPLSYKKLLQAVQNKFPQSMKELKEAVASLKEEYIRDERGFFLLEASDGISLSSCPEFYEEIKLLVRINNVKISKSSLEVLALVAYKQPITRLEVESFRGVSCQSAFSFLLEEEFIEAAGHKQVVGNPKLYKTTKKFLTHFDICSLSELPDYSTFASKGSSLFEDG